MADLYIPSIYDPTKKPLLGQPLVQKANGLVGSWLMNEGGGDTVRDTSGYGNDGIGTDLLWLGGRSGPAIGLNGTSTWVNLPAAVKTQFQPGLSIACWARTDQVASSTEYFVAQRGSGDNCFYMFWDTGEDINFAVRNVADNTQVANHDGTFMVDGLWHHLVGTYDGANVKMYIDGVVGPDQPALTGLTGPVTNDIRVTFGSLDGGASGRFEGEIDNVLIYNRGLTAAEVQRLYIDSFWQYRPEPIYIGDADAPPTGIPILRRRRECA